MEDKRCEQCANTSKKTFIEIAKAITKAKSRERPKKKMEVITAKTSASNQASPTPDDEDYG